MLWQTVRSAISRSEGDAHDAHEKMQKAIADIDRALDHMADAQRDLRCALTELAVLKRLADEHGEEHEIPYESGR